MIRVEKRCKSSAIELKHRSYSAWKRLMEYYDRWDVAAKEKNFGYCEELERKIKRLHDEYGLKES